MTKEKDTVIRKLISLYPADLERLERITAESGLTSSGQIRQWIWAEELKEDNDV